MCSRIVYFERFNCRSSRTIGRQSSAAADDGRRSDQTDVAVKQTVGGQIKLRGDLTQRRECISRTEFEYFLEEFDRNAREGAIFGGGLHCPAREPRALLSIKKSAYFFPVGRVG